VQVFSEGGGATEFEIAQDAFLLVGERACLPVRRGKAPEDLRDLEVRTPGGVLVHHRGLIRSAIASSGEDAFAMVAVLTCT
jgi:hypothetical protein